MNAQVEADFSGEAVGRLLALAAALSAGCAPGPVTDAVDAVGTDVHDTDTVDVDPADTDDTDAVDTDPPDTLVADTDADTDAPPGVRSDLRSMALTYTVELTWDAAGLALCEEVFDTSDGACDCTAVFRGAGTLDESDGTRNRYVGTFEVVSSDCARPKLAPFAGLRYDETFVARPADGLAYHTWRFEPAGDVGHEWVMHDDAADDTICLQGCASSALELGQYWIRFDRPRPSIDPVTSTLSYDETGQLVSSAYVQTYRHHLDVVFSDLPTPPAAP